MLTTLQEFHTLDTKTSVLKLWKNPQMHLGLLVKWSERSDALRLYLPPEQTQLILQIQDV